MIMPSLLADLLAQAREQTARRRAYLPEAELDRLAGSQAPPQDFAAALRFPGRLAVIAEMKRRTPSMGLLAESYDPAGLARAYAGADAISVLTHEGGFGGSAEHLAQARAEARQPILRKDFIADAYQVREARACGADAVLLIVAALKPRELAALLRLTRDLGMEALVEVHDEAEAQAALEADARVLGVNHRDLRTFSVDLALTERLRPVVPPDLVFVAESGIHDGAAARRMREAGADAILVGEALMRSADPAAKVAELQVR